MTEVNWTKTHKEILRRPLTADVTYILQVQVHQNSQIALESYVEVLVGSLNTLFAGNLDMRKANLCHRLTEALKVKTKI